MRSRREKVVGPGHAVPLVRNAKGGVRAYARLKGPQPQPRGGTIICVFLDVLQALLCGFTTPRPGAAFPPTSGSPRAVTCVRAAAVSTRCMDAFRSR
jgi:hypothetical protein